MVPPSKTSSSSQVSKSSTPRHSNGSSKALSNASDKDSRDAQRSNSASLPKSHHSEKRKNSSSVHRSRAASSPIAEAVSNHGYMTGTQYHQPGEESLHDPSQPGGVTGSQTQRPPLKIRAQSNTTVPKGGASSSTHAFNTVSPTADGNNEYDDLQSPIGTEDEQGRRRVERDNTSGEESGEDEITHDPFFQRYSRQQHETEVDEDEEDGLSMPSSNSSTKVDQPRPDHNQLSAMNSNILKRQASEKRSGRSPLGTPHGPLSPQYWNNSQTVLKPLQEFNVAVLGAPQVGKSTFVQRAFDLKDLPSILFTRRKMSLDGTVYVVRTVELNYHDLDLDDEKCICWPDVLGGTPVPAIDGVFILYDVMNRDSLIQVPEALSGTCNAGIPYLLVACKCDYSPNIRPVDPNSVDEPLKAYFGDVKTFQTSESSPDTQKRCMAFMLRQMISKRKHQFNANPNRRRANSTATHQSTMHSSLQKHNRAASEISMNMYHSASRSRRPEQNSPISTRSKSHQQLLALNNSGSTLFDPEQTVNETTEDLDSSAEVGVNLKSPKSAGNMTQPPDSALTFDELVNRLLAQPLSKTETKFQAIFLALYRLFASPGRLLDAIIERFEAAGRDGVSQLLTVNTQQRHLAILNDWISVYPGDFAFTLTRLKLHSFITRLAGARIFAVAARELAGNLDYAVEDDDTDWACSDRSNSTISTASATTTSIITKGIAGLAVTVDSVPLPPHYTVQHSHASPIVSPTSGSSQLSSTQSLLTLVDQATKQATTFAPTSRFPLTKVQWRQFMAMAEDSVARELTRMDWIMFLSIRPRDLMRHVTMTDAQKAGTNGATNGSNSSINLNIHTSVHLENVQRIIDHFNHLAAWVANLVLFRDKPKHRALMLEKLMKVARELRKMNNYNALGALIAGINSSSVQRLHATKELIDPVAGRDFMKLEILMSPQRSHAAYRLAWENSSGERIPYLPLHRRDLVAAEQGNRTFVGDDADAEGNSSKKVNWKKFEIMGEVVVGMQRAKETPYPPVAKNEEVSRLVLDLAIEKDEDKLYDRSQQLESSSGGNKQRRFAWLQGGS